MCSKLVNFWLFEFKKVLEISILQTLFRAILLICFIPLSSHLLADEQQQLDQIKQQIEKKLPTIRIESISKSRMPGVYEILSSGQILYVSADANFLISGKLFSIKDGIEDLTAESMQRIDMKMAPMRRDKVGAVNDADMIIFKAANEKHLVTVFTDVDCGYCRKLHKEMDNYHKLGISVQYMGFPRAGLGSSSHKKLQTVWCADDPIAAMDKAKIQRTFGTNTCDDPIASHLKLVREFGLNGTPAIILKSGRLIAGFAEADQLLKAIEKDEREIANTVAKAE